MALIVEFVADFICPWCLVGQRRLERALAKLGAREIELRWVPYELNPDMPEAGMDRRAYRSAKFGSWERSQELDAGTVRAGQAEGVTFDYDKMTRTPNTFAAHRLVALAQEQDQAQAQAQAQNQNQGMALAAAILRGYFSEGRDIGDLQVLFELGRSHGLSEAQLEAFAAGEGSTMVRQQVLAQLQRGVRAVPTIAFGGVQLQGAADVETLAEELRRAVERAPAPNGQVRA